MGEINPGSSPFYPGLVTQAICASVFSHESWMVITPASAGVVRVELTQVKHLVLSSSVALELFAVIRAVFLLPSKLTACLVRSIA